ncbi:hypothetical protein V1477_006843 [Vespula maculifrons]|uniref:Uncharacterized protein n=2 Tax=Vespula TaxID=7451 RepID=A0A834JUT2_VESVU|nr:hypothetical protein HZH66_008208 [Vespula vulgaris]
MTRSLEVVGLQNNMTAITLTLKHALLFGYVTLSNVITSRQRLESSIYGTASAALPQAAKGLSRKLL